MVRIGIDVGGTGIKSGWLDENDGIHAADSIPTRLDLGQTLWLDRLAEHARTLGTPSRLGLGVPGLFEPGTRLISANPNLPALEGIDLGREMQSRLGLPAESIAVENDANVAALGESKLGAGKTKGDMMMVTLGTGVGGGLVMDGKVMRGSRGCGAELGHVAIHDRDTSPVPCGCGKYGCLESFASATAAMRRAKTAGLTPDLPELTQKARDTAGPERELLLAIGHDLGLGIGQVLVLLDIPTVVVGGGFGRALDTMLPGIRAGIADRDFAGREPEILPAALGNDAGWVGAALLATMGKA